MPVHAADCRMLPAYYRDVHTQGYTMVMSEKEIRPFGFESTFEYIFVQPYVFKDVGLCKPKAASEAPFQEVWYLYGYVTIFLARPGILFGGYYSRQNTFAVLISISCSQRESVTVSFRVSCWSVLGILGFGVQLALLEGGLQLQVKAKVKT